MPSDNDIFRKGIFHYPALRVRNQGTDLLFSGYRSRNKINQAMEIIDRKTILLDAIAQFFYSFIDKLGER
jgi:hypothetical protein